MAARGVLGGAGVCGRGRRVSRFGRVAQVRFTLYGARVNSPVMFSLDTPASTPTPTPTPGLGGGPIRKNDTAGVRAYTKLGVAPLYQNGDLVYYQTISGDINWSSPGLGTKGTVADSADVRDGTPLGAYMSSFGGDLTAPKYLVSSPPPWPIEHQADNAQNPNPGANNFIVYYTDKSGTVKCLRGSGGEDSQGSPVRPPGEYQTMQLNQSYKASESNGPLAFSATYVYSDDVTTVATDLFFHDDQGVVRSLVNNLYYNTTQSEQVNITGSVGNVMAVVRPTYTDTTYLFLRHTEGNGSLQMFYRDYETSGPWLPGPFSPMEVPSWAYFCASDDMLVFQAFNGTLQAVSLNIGATPHWTWGTVANVTTEAVANGTSLSCRLSDGYGDEPDDDWEAVYYQGADGCIYIAEKEGPYWYRSLVDT
jgi:hypothetical protein